MEKRRKKLITAEWKKLYMSNSVTYTPLFVLRSLNQGHMGCTNKKHIQNLDQNSHKTSTRVTLRWRKTITNRFQKKYVLIMWTGLNWFRPKLFIFIYIFCTVSPCSDCRLVSLLIHSLQDSVGNRIVAAPSRSDHSLLSLAKHRTRLLLTACLCP